MLSLSLACLPSSRDSWLPTQDKLILSLVGFSSSTHYLAFFSLSLAWLSSSLQSDGCLHSELMDEYSNGGLVNEEDLPPIITLPCPIRVFTKVLAIVPCFYPLYLDLSLLYLLFMHYMHIRPQSQISDSNSSHKKKIIKSME